MTVAELAHKIWQERQRAQQPAPVQTKTVPETPEAKGDAQHFEVVHKRNAHCELWSEQADTVTANEIPEIAVLWRFNA